MRIKEETIKIAKDNGFELQSLNMGFDTIAKLIVDDNEFVVGSQFHRLIVVNRVYLEEKSSSINEAEFNNKIINAIKEFINSYDGKPYLRSIENEKLDFPSSSDVVKQEVKKYGEFLNSSFYNKIVSDAVENNDISTGKETETYIDSLSKKIKNDTSYKMGTNKED